MKHELTQRFYFEAAHTLNRQQETESSRRIHGHTYHACVTVGGAKDPETGMVVDLALLRAEIAQTRSLLDHRFLDDVEGLGPATLENLCEFIYRGLSRSLSQVLTVEVAREASGDSCLLRVPSANSP